MAASAGVPLLHSLLAAACALAASISQCRWPSVCCQEPARCTCLGARNSGTGRPALYTACQGLTLTCGGFQLRCMDVAGAVAPLPPPLMQQAETLLAELKRWHAQSSIDGHGNVWILKPGSKSRGRGIFCTNNMKEVKVRSCCTQARC